MGYKHFGWRSDQPRVRPAHRGPYKKRVKLATGPMSISKNGNYRTFDEFCEEQRLAVEARLFGLLPSEDDREMTAQERNSGRLLLRDMLYESRGNVSGAIGQHDNPDNEGEVV